MDNINTFAQVTRILVNSHCRLITNSFIISLLFMIVGCISCQPQEIFIGSTSTTVLRSPSRTVVKSSLPFREIWRWSGTIDARYEPMIFFGEDFVVIASWEYEGHKILVFDALTGKVVWESQYISNLRSLNIDKERVYAATITYVQAYDLQTGVILWKGAEQPRSKRGGLFVYPKEEYVEVYDFVEGRLYYLDRETGSTLSTLQQMNIFFQRGQENYFRTCNFECSLAAVNNVNGARIWERKFEGRPRAWPIFRNNIMFLGTEDAIYALEIETGNSRWKVKDNYVTNIAIGGDLIYAIRDDAAIVGLDYQTGHIVGIIEMNPGRTKQDDEKLEYDTYYDIAASDKFLAAFYGNSGELIVFEKIDK